MGAEVEAASDAVSLLTTRSTRWSTPSAPYVHDAIYHAHRSDTDAATADAYEARAGFLTHAVDTEAATADFLVAFTRRQTPAPDLPLTSPRPPTHTR